jgi:hypothetical protein
VKYNDGQKSRWKPRSTYGDRSWLDDVQMGGKMGGKSSSGSGADVASDYDTALSSDDSDVFDLSPSTLPLNQLLVSDLYLKETLATSLFAALTNAESLCTVKPFWLYWRNLTVKDNVNTKRVLHMAFRKFANGLSVAASKHVQFRLFRSKLVKLLAVPNARLASCVVEWRIHFSTALVQRALLSLRNANKQMCSITNACYLDALK